METEAAGLLKTDETSRQARHDSDKLGTWSAAMFLFKSTVGLGVFTYPYVFAKVGILWGSILSAIVCYVLTYGMYVATKIADDLEKEEQNGQLELNDWHLVTSIVCSKTMSKVKAEIFATVASVSSFGENTAFIIATFLEISAHTQEFFGVSLTTIKFVILAYYLAATVYAVYPEQLNFVSYISGIAVILVIMIFSIDNLRIIISGKPEPGFPSDRNYELFNFANSGLFLGVCGFSYESSTTLFTVRSGMKEKSLMSKSIVYCFSLICLIYTAFSLSYYFAYGKDDMKSIIFLFYLQRTRPIFYMIGVFYCVILLLFTPLFNIANSDILENIPAINNCLKSPDGSRSTFKLIAFRLLLFALCSLPAFVAEKIEVVMSLAGCIFVPIICFYIPVLLNLLYQKTRSKKISPLVILHDITILILGTSISVLGMIDTINKAKN